MNAKRMLVSLVPWVLFSFMIHRRGEQAAGIAALLAAALAVVLIVRAARHGIKIIDVAGVATFGLMGVACLAGGPSVTSWVADYGRGASVLVLAVVMLVSVATVPFSEQYARESVPREFWGSPEFRAVNRKISALWGVVVLVMAGGHLLAGYLDPMTAPDPGVRPVDLLLNWVVPVVLIFVAVNGTKNLAGRVSGQPRSSSDTTGAATTVR